jgi:cytochrome P450
MAVVKVPITRSITGHKALREALRDTTTYSSDLQGDADVRDYRQLPLEVDPPKHHAYRAALAPYFVKPYVDRFSDSFSKNSDALIKSFFTNENLSQRDVTTHLALPLVMHNLGSFYRRPQDVEEWISWGADVWTATGKNRDGSVLHAYLDRIYDEAIKSPSDDIWSELAQLEVDGKVISPIEFRGIAGIMLAGGRDTVVKLLTGMVWHFGNHPEDLNWLSDEQQYLETAINEFLRYLTPNTGMARTTTPETGATDLPTDRYVNMNFFSGNFDHEVYPNPGEIDLKRTRNPHLSFGFGPHTCIGNHLAENEAKIFLQALIKSGMKWEISTQSEITFYDGELSKVPQHFSQVFIENVESR